MVVDSCYWLGICFQQENRGAGAPPARADPHRYVNNTLYKCYNSRGTAATGHCNRTDKKANGGMVWLNMADKAFLDAHPRWVLKHETGHQVGLGHGGCEDSVMRTDQCGSGPEYLRPHDINAINSWCL